jgi:hypothetical protein
MSVREREIKQLISRSRGIPEAERFFSFRLDSSKVLAETANEILSQTPPSFGMCAQLNASWAGLLNECYSIPAIAVAGDLKISGKRVFKCKKNLPEPSKSGKVITGHWDGHCWIEIDGFIGDLSIFRTAYAITGSSVLKDYVISNFGLNRGGFICRNNELPNGMQYIPRFVLKDGQISGFIAGMGYLLQQQGMLPP